MGVFCLAGFYMIKLFSAVFAILLTGNVSTAHAQHLYTFGDSLSDNGNYFIASGGIYPPLDTYSWGRASNGSTWSARIGYHLGHAPNADYLREPWGGFQSDLTGWNFAHYGATIDPTLAPTKGQRLPSQVDFFQSLALDGTFWIDPNDAFTIWAGTNDYLAYGAANPENQVSILMDQVKKINAVGGQNIMVFDLPFWSDAPIGLNYDSASLNSLISLHNTELKAAILTLSSQQGVDVYYVPVSELYLDVMNNPGDYGFDIVAPGQGTSGHCLGDGLVLNDCTSNYAFYDSLHPSTAMHRWIGNFGRAQYFAIQASKSYSGIAASSSAPALAYQNAALRGQAANLTAPGWQTVRKGNVQLVTYSDPQSKSQQNISLIADNLNSENSFSLMGARADLPSGMTFGFAVSSGTPDRTNNPQQPITSSSGWVVQLEKKYGGYSAFLLANGIEQSYLRRRQTGFARDPIITAAYEQAQSAVMFGFEKSIYVGGFDLNSGFALGFVRQDRSAVREQGLTTLVSFNTPAESQMDEVSEIHMSLAKSGRLGAMNIELGSDFSYSHINGDAYSSWSMLGAHDFTHFDHVAAREAALLSGFAAIEAASGVAGSVRLSVGQSDLEPVQAASLQLSYRW